MTSLLKVDEVADRLGQHPQTIRKRTRRGEFTDVAINLGTDRRPQWRYDPTRLAKWIEAHAAA